MSLLRAIFTRRMLVCLTTGFASGLPLYVLIQMLPAWFEDSGVDLKTTGLLALTGMPYTWKFLWAPLMDRFVPPFLGRRRGWALIAQLTLMLALAALSACDPNGGLAPIFALALLIAFASASQDIVLDAVRREILADSELGLGNSLFVNAYRIAGLVPGSLALILADRLPWSFVHLVVAAFVGVGVLTTLLMAEPASEVPPPRSFREAVVEPFRQFFRSRGPRGALGVLAFMLLYKLGDSMATALITPFYLDIGYSLSDVGTVAKGAALWASIGGGLAGGLLMLRIGIHRALWLFGVVQLVSILGFAALASVGAPLVAAESAALSVVSRLGGPVSAGALAVHVAGTCVVEAVPDPGLDWLFWVVSFEYLGVGLGTAAFVAFIASCTDKRYTATQLALLTSLTGLPRTFANASTGWIVTSLGWTGFFLACTAIAVPGMLMLPWIAPWRSSAEER